MRKLETSTITINYVIQSDFGLTVCYNNDTMKEEKCLKKKHTLIQETTNKIPFILHFIVQVVFGMLHVEVCLLLCRIGTLSSSKWKRLICKISYFQVIFIAVLSSAEVTQIKCQTTTTDRLTNVTKSNVQHSEHSEAMHRL